MHLLSASALARLKSNRRASDHFEKFKGTYARYAKEMKDFCAKFPLMNKPETRVNLVTIMILEMDPMIWGLSNSNMTVREVADTFARMVVEHES